MNKKKPNDNDRYARKCAYGLVAYCEETGCDKCIFTKFGEWGKPEGCPMYAGFPMDWRTKLDKIFNEEE